MSTGETTDVAHDTFMSAYAKFEVNILKNIFGSHPESMYQQ